MVMSLNKCQIYVNFTDASYIAIFCKSARVSSEAKVCLNLAVHSFKQLRSSACANIIFGSPITESKIRLQDNLCPNLCSIEGISELVQGNISKF